MTDDAAKRKAAVITVSDRCARGETEDRSGPVVARSLREAGFDTEAAEIVPDEMGFLQEAILRLARTCQLVVTTGGTGIAPRDITPEATRAVLDREIPGMAEAMRARSLTVTPTAMLSRAVCGILDTTVVVNLPGSPKAAAENLEAVLPALPHAIDLILDEVRDCGR